MTYELYSWEPHAILKNYKKFFLKVMTSTKFNLLQKFCRFISVGGVILGKFSQFVQIFSLIQHRICQWIYKKNHLRNNFIQYEYWHIVIGISISKYINEIY